MMHRTRVLAFSCAVTLAAVLAIPGAAFAVLQNEYGMKYAGQQICTSCHDLSYGETTHGRFAKVGADPSADYMWPAGRASVGEMLLKSQVAFTLGAGTGLREYLVNNKVAAVGPTPVVYTEVQGTDRYATAVNASKAGFASATTVVVATGETFPDAMGGAALAGAVHGPILLTKSDSVSKAVIDEIGRLGATKVYVLGGTPAVSAAAFSQLDDLASVEATRVSGADRYATALAVADETIKVLGGSYGGAAVMATGVNFPDALGSSPLMYAKGMPLVLVDSAGNFTLPTGVTKVTIVGGTTVVPASVESALGTKFDSRIAGGDRYATGAAVAQYGVSKGLKWDGVGIATGENFPDALSAGPLLGSKGSVMLLTRTANLSSDAAGKLSANKGTIGHATFMGGTPAVSTNTRDQVKAILTGISTVADTNPFVVPTLEWDPIAPDTWEMGANGIEYEAYTCGNCHHLGWVAKGSKPAKGTFAATAVTGTINAWVTDPTGPTTSPEKYVAGSSIQCEVCHGTGQAGVGVGNHFGNYTSQVKILRGTQLLDSGVCGKCHASWAAGNTLGFTPDQNIFTFATPFAKTDVPTEATWNGGTNAATGKAWKFFPNGANRSNKHVYFSEWALSGHAFRGAYNTDRENPRVTPYMANHTGHYDSTGAYGGTAPCAKCHTGEGYAVRKGLKIMEDYDLTAPGATGQMGQECVTCHIPHGAGTDNGMAVRKPDAAVTQSGITMTSICEDCHNWQRDQEGKTGFETNPAPIKNLTDRGGYSHPTREIFNGVGMYEVADAGKFMPGVKCEQCHMPATKSDFPDKTGLQRYANQSWKRYSHSMHIMEPGNAVEWGLAAWGDSCSPCHAGESQASLQTAIETWQDDAASASVEASAAYAAAYAAAPESVEDTNTPAFKALMGRAYYNYRNYLGEGSMGAHNPEYIVEGLNAATKMAKSVNGDFVHFASGTAMSGANYVVGTLHNGDGSGAADAKLVITFDNDSPATVYSDANGNFSYVFDSGLTATSITWKRCSDAAADRVYSPPTPQ